LAQQAAAPAASTQQTSAAATAAPRWTAEDAAAFSEARIAAFKASLALKGDQEKNWTPFETAIRDLTKQRNARIEKVVAERQRAAGQTPDAVAMLRQRADTLGDASANLKRLADAAEPLYKSLDDSQKRRMLVLLTGARAQR